MVEPDVEPENCDVERHDPREHVVDRRHTLARRAISPEREIRPATRELALGIEALERFARRGGLVLGICNGFQVLCESGLLPGALTRNSHLHFRNRDQGLRIERADTAWTAGYEQGQRIVVPVKNGEGRYVAAPAELERLEGEGRVAVRYVDGNPNGSLNDIAGVTSADGRVVGLMPHPEHAVDPLLGSADGAFILASLVDAARERALAVV